jgi:hypothetical protein
MRVKPFSGSSIRPIGGAPEIPVRVSVPSVPDMMIDLICPVLFGSVTGTVPGSVIPPAKCRVSR